MSNLNNAELFDESESNPFNVDEYIERLAWRTRASFLSGLKFLIDVVFFYFKLMSNPNYSSENNFDPQLLYDEFCSHIQELRTLGTGFY